MNGVLSAFSDYVIMKVIGAIASAPRPERDNDSTNLLSVDYGSGVGRSASHVP